MSKGIDWKAAAEFWAYQPVKVVEAPASKKFIQAIDRFVEEKFEKEKLAPAGVADARTLIRRASFEGWHDVWGDG